MPVREVRFTKMYLKQEDLNHTGAHKINNTIGQILLARRMGKKRIIAETGAGQRRGGNSHSLCPDEHGVHRIHGQNGCRTPAHQCRKMKMLGATVVPVTSGNMTLKDATNRSHPRLVLPSLGYVLHHRFYRRIAPYPDMVARLQSVISEEIKTASGERRT